jgi:hypothetical protein
MTYVGSSRCALNFQQGSNTTGGSPAQAIHRGGRRCGLWIRRGHNGRIWVLHGGVLRLVGDGGQSRAAAMAAWDAADGRRCVHVANMASYVISSSVILVRV